MRKTIVLVVCCLSLHTMAMTPTAKISTGKTVATSSGNAAYLVDNNFAGTNFNVSNNSWIAINIGTGKTNVYFNWNNPAYTWSDVVAGSGSCKNTPLMPVNYTIQKSGNSTNGSDGTWTTVVTITNNNVTARGHVVDFSDASWIKMNITTGGGQISEVEVFDLSSGGNDLWFFPGTSITANTYKGTPPAKNYADLIKQSYPAFTPMMVRGGIPCISSNQLKNDINLYLAAAGNVKYWAIEMGTNDAWGGTNGGVSNFKNNMQAVITACKNAGIQPIIARMLSTNSSAAGWQVHPNYLTAIDDLTKQNNLISGPDLYTYFLSHTNELTSDGVHPNAAGAASIQRLWAEMMGPLLYASTNPTPTVSITSPANNSSVCAGTPIILNATASVSSGSVSKVDFYDGNSLLFSDNSSPYSYTWNGATVGSHTIRAISTTVANETSAPAIATITVNAPTVIEPFMQVNGGTWAAQTSATLCQGGSINIGPHPYDVSTGWAWTGPNNFSSEVREIGFANITTAQGGTYTVSFKDANNCTSSLAIPVTVNAKPTVAITSPANNATVSDASLTINASISGSGISNVQFYNGNTMLGTDNSAPYDYAWNNIENGSYTLYAKATNANNCADTATAKVTVTLITGLDDTEHSTEITCFPNPFNTSFRIKAPNHFDYVIMDAKGTEMEKGSAQNAVLAGKEFASGVYLVKINTDSKSVLLRTTKR